jgi:hypothetical protein
LQAAESVHLPTKAMPISLKSQIWARTKQMVKGRAVKAAELEDDDTEPNAYLSKLIRANWAEYVSIEEQDLLAAHLRREHARIWGVVEAANVLTRISRKADGYDPERAEQAHLLLCRLRTLMQQTFTTAPGKWGKQGPQAPTSTRDKAPRPRVRVQVTGLSADASTAEIARAIRDTYGVQISAEDVLTDAEGGEIVDWVEMTESQRDKVYAQALAGQHLDMTKPADQTNGGQPCRVVTGHVDVDLVASICELVDEELLSMCNTLVRVAERTGLPKGAVVAELTHRCVPTALTLALEDEDAPGQLQGIMPSYRALIKRAEYFDILPPLDRVSVDDMSSKQLTALLREVGLASSGSRKSLLARLHAANILDATVIAANRGKRARVQAPKDL